MVFTQDGKVVMTYDEYDKEWEIASKIHSASLNEATPAKKMFFSDIYFPHVEDIEKAFSNGGKLKDFFHYLFYYYVQKVDVRKEDKDDYEASMKLIKKIMDSAIVFADEE